MSSIAGLLPTDILVFREGNTFKIPASDLVAGDIVRISLGSYVGVYFCFMVFFLVHQLIFFLHAARFSQESTCRCSSSRGFK